MDLEQPEVIQDSAPTSNTPEPPNSDQTNELDASLLTQQEEPEEVEDELEGVKLRGKKEALERIKAERLMQADYTRKTQEVADQRRTFEQERTQFQETAKSHQEHIREVARLVAIDERLGQLQQYLPQINQQDPQQAQALLIELQQLQAQRGQLQGSLAQKEQQRQLNAQQESAKRANEAEAIVMREVKDWGPEKLKAFVDAGQKAGIEPEGVRQMLIQFPQAARFMNKALQYDKLLAQRLQKPAAEPPKPATRVGGGSAANTKPLSDVTDPREWAELRRQRKSQNR
jgi:hypothetical protein